jgi:hypothetical protein
MKRSLTHLMVTAAALAVAAGMASAQTLKADIELTFRAGSTVMQPGQYVVTVDSQSRTVWFHNLDTKQSVILAPIGDDAPKAWVAAAKPVVAFSCGEEGKCTLTGMWDGRDSYAYKFLSPRAHNEKVAQVLIPLTRAD